MKFGYTAALLFVWSYINKERQVIPMLNGKRVLVAHPDPIYCGAVAAVLAQAGASTIIATTIDEALGQFRALNRQVDLALTLLTNGAPQADDEVSFSDWRTHLLPRLAAA